MASVARKELFSTIEQQREKIAKYESKISDLVRAYKNLAKEKEALQEGLAAVTHNPLQDVTPTNQETYNKDKNSEKEVDGRVVKEYDEESNCSASSSSDNHELTLIRNKVSTLTSSLQTLTAEKNRMEGSLKEDRKRILDEKKKTEQKLKSETDQWSKLKIEYEAKIQEMKNRIIVFQHEREQETSNNMIMLREVESRLAKERNEKEKMEKMLDETREQNRQFALAIGTRSQEKKQQKQITDLQNELEQVRCRLKKAEQQCEEPPMLKLLQEQMEEMRQQYTAAIVQERIRAEAAEKSVRNLTQLHEERVVALEANLTELSQTAANYDRTKQAHLEIIHTLKEQVAELTEENTALSSQNSTTASHADEAQETDINFLIKKLIDLWGKIQLLQAKNKALDIEGLLTGSEVLHKRCISEYDQLKEEIEELKAKTQKDKEGTKHCNCGLKDQTEEMRERVRSMNTAAQLTQATHKQQVSSLSQELQKMKLKHKEALRQLEQEHKGIVNNLEHQLANHCQRSLNTLQDRDEEIHRLSKEIFQLKKEAQAQPATVAAALLSQVSSGRADGPLLHHLEELSRKEMEVSELRKDKMQLERSMREIQMLAIDKQQYMQDTIEDLKEHVERLKRNTSREGENLEYLKNVVLQYMTSSDVESRYVILNAIAAVLKFTPSETERVKKCLALWWWQAPNRTKGATPRIARSPSVSATSTFIGSTSIALTNKGASNRDRFLSENN